MYAGESLARREVELWCGSFGEGAGERAGLMLERMAATSSPMRLKLRIVKFERRFARSGCGGLSCPLRWCGVDFGF